MTEEEKKASREQRAKMFIEELNELKLKFGVEISIEEVSDGHYGTELEVELEVFDKDEEFGGWNSYPAAHTQPARFDLTDGVDWWANK